MELDEVLLDKLFEHKERLISLARQLDIAEFLQWAEELSKKAELRLPRSILEFLQENNSETDGAKRDSKLLYAIAVIHYQGAVEKFESGDFDTSLKAAFDLEYILGKVRGIAVHQERIAKERVGIRHADTYANKRLAIEFYVENNLCTYSNQKAAEMLEKQVPLGVRTLVGYISAYKKFLGISQRSEFGSVLHSLHDDALLKLENPQCFTVEELALAKLICDSVKQIEDHRITLFVTEGIERAERIIHGLEKYAVETMRQKAQGGIK